jgi:hypothetical protein
MAYCHQPGVARPVLVRDLALEVDGSGRYRGLAHVDQSGGSDSWKYLGNVHGLAW